MLSTYDQVGETSAQFGLSLLTSSKKGKWDNFDESVKHRTELEKHPFDLDLPTPSRDGWRENCNVYFIRTGATDISVRAMIAQINLTLSNETGLSRLREIQVQHSKDRLSHHFTFFEVWTNMGVLICGDCTDFSGGGGFGTRQMRSVFSLLSLVHNKKIETVEIPYAWTQVQVRRKCSDLGISLD